MLFKPTSKKASIANVVVVITEEHVINCAPLTPTFLPKKPDTIDPNNGSPPPATSKNEVLKFLSVNTIVIPPANTGKDNNSKTDVTITAQPNKANLCSLIPGLLIFKIVVMKFIEPNKLLIPDRCKAKIAKSTLGPL
nr:hypothetical protein [Tanacetum cinerariifolium]